MLGYRDKWDINRINMTFYWRRTGGNAKKVYVRLCLPMVTEERDENTHHMR